MCWNASFLKLSNLYPPKSDISEWNLLNWRAKNLTMPKTPAASKKSLRTRITLARIKEAEQLYSIRSTRSSPNRNPSTSDKRCFIDLFAGCGGLSLGLEQVGFRPLLFSEINRSAAQTYLANRGGRGIIPVGDIYHLTDDNLRLMKLSWDYDGVTDVDLVCGGPPCQATAGSAIGDHSGLGSAGCQPLVSARGRNGRPDFVFSKQKLVVFVDGCFWHGCPRHSQHVSKSAANWKDKIAANKKRDLRSTKCLRLRGWRVLRIWEHDLIPRRRRYLTKRLEVLVNDRLNSNRVR
jgi:DNA mismatch endonuclease Vsr